ncbi:MAG: transmembrane 220 family protein [Ginsengibacter sp.]
MKIFNFFFVFVFIVFAALQYNDPDPYVWMPLYLYAALLCWFAAKKKFNPKTYWLGFVVYGAYAVYKIFDENGLADWITKHHAQNIAETMKAETPWVEESREFFGLVIMIAVLGINYFYLRKYHKREVEKLKRS